MKTRRKTLEELLQPSPRDLEREAKTRADRLAPYLPGTEPKAVRYGAQTPEPEGSA